MYFPKFLNQDVNTITIKPPLSGHSLNTVKPYYGEFSLSPGSKFIVVIKAGRLQDWSQEEHRPGAVLCCLLLLLLLFL